MGDIESPERKNTDDISLSQKSEESFFFRKFDFSLYYTITFFSYGSHTSKTRLFRVVSRCRETGRAVRVCSGKRMYHLPPEGDKTLGHDTSIDAGKTRSPRRTEPPAPAAHTDELFRTRKGSRIMIRTGTRRRHSWWMKRTRRALCHTSDFRASFLQFLQGSTQVLSRSPASL